MWRILIVTLFLLIRADDKRQLDIVRLLRLETVSGARRSMSCQPASTSQLAMRFNASLPDIARKMSLPSSPRGMLNIHKQLCEQIDPVLRAFMLSL